MRLTHEGGRAGKHSGCPRYSEPLRAHLQAIPLREPPDIIRLDQRLHDSLHGASTDAQPRRTHPDEKKLAIKDQIAALTQARVATH